MAPAAGQCPAAAPGWWPTSWPASSPKSTSKAWGWSGWRLRDNAFMQRITPDRRWPLFDTAAVRGVEQSATASLAPHTLMRRAGLAVARLALALSPHSRTIWIACGPGNNGGDGMEAAAHLRAWG